MIRVAIILVLAMFGSSVLTQNPRSATNLALEIYQTCLKDYSTSCVQPKAMQWFNEVVHADEISLTDNLSILRTSSFKNSNKYEHRSLEELNDIFNNIDNFLETHALHIKAPAFFRTAESRSLVPDYLLDNVLTKDAVVPLVSKSETKGRGMLRKVVLPFLLGLKFKTMILVPLALGLIALKTWKAMTLGLLSLVLSGALVVFKIAKPKIVNYEVVHYPPPHVEHIDHYPHHVEHIVPHHIEHVPHHVDHHIDLPHHVNHVEHIEHASPTWDPQDWSRSSQEPAKDAQDMAYAGQKH